MMEDEKKKEEENVSGLEEKLCQAVHPNGEKQEEGEGENSSVCEDESDFEMLKRENEELRAELEGRKKLGERLENEISEFSEMFPDVPLSEVPEEIWAEVKKGLPLSAAYARHEKRTTENKRRINEANSHAREKSGGSLQNDGGEGWYSPEDVRKMSASEVKKNYSKIISSMKRWG